MSDSTPQTVTLQKITVTYSPEEDRLRLTADAGHDQTVVYWITRRMLGVLLSPMFKWLEQSAEKGISNDQLISERNREARLAMAQSSAQAKMQEESPVNALPDSQQFLLTSVDVKTEAARFFLLLPLSDHQKGLIPFEQESLLQWLDIIHRIIGHASWQLPQWPNWFLEGQSPRKTEHKALH
jgi:hypothetical protein